MDSYFDEVIMNVCVDDIREALPILRRIRAAGYKLNFHVDHKTSNSRMYCFPAIRVDVKMQDAACRFEQVGTKELPVYDVMCDGDLGELDELTA